MIPKQILFCLLFLITGNLLSQTPLTSNTRQKMSDRDGVVYTYDLAGNYEASLPCYIDQNDREIKQGNGWISDAIEAQLRADAFFYQATNKIIQARLSKTPSGPVQAMVEIISGAGYWLDCPNGSGDMKFQCSIIKTSYRVLLDTVSDVIYVAEVRNDLVQEINYVHLGVKHFEADPESYERPVQRGATSCAAPTPPVPPIEGPEITEEPVAPDVPEAPIIVSVADPVALISADRAMGDAPLTIQFDGRESYDPDGGEIVTYVWSFEDGTISNSAQPIHIFNQPGQYTVRLTVTDDEGAFAIAKTNVFASIPASGDSCWLDIYTLRNCGGRIDTVSITPIKVSCPEPERPSVVWTECCCQDVAGESDDQSRLQLAAGPIYQRFQGQLTEYGLGLDAQIRIRLGQKRKFAVFADAVVYPSQTAKPLDDRPHKWSDFYNDKDPVTGLPLSWHRGTSRATGSLGLGGEFAPVKWFYIQLIGGLQRTWQQEEISDPRKHPTNQFLGFKEQVNWGEARIGIRKSHLEIFFGRKMLGENRPFTLIPQNDLGGTTNPKLDKTVHGGVMLVF